MNVYQRQADDYTASAAGVFMQESETSSAGWLMEVERQVPILYGMGLQLLMEEMGMSPWKAAAAWMVVFAVVITTSAAVFAQETALRWYAYFYNDGLKELTRVWEDGSVESFPLGLQQEVYFSAFDMAFTPDGRRTAFCPVSYPADAPYGQSILIVRDIEAGINLIEQPLDGTVGCRTGKAAFSPDGRFVVVSRTNMAPGASTDALPGQTLWQIQVIEVATGAVITELGSDSPAAAAVNMMTMPMIPYVMQFDGESVIFAEVPYGIGGGGEFRAFRWTLAAAGLESVPYWGKITIEKLVSTGEMVWPDVDPNRPTGIPAGPMPANNVVKVLGADGVERTVFVSEPEWLVASAQFIDGGAKIAAYLVSSWDDSNPDVSRTRWIAVDRQGQVSELALFDSANTTYSQLMPMPSGVALYSWEYPTSPDANGLMIPTMTLVALRDGQTPETLWTQQAPELMTLWDFAWSFPLPQTADLAPFIDLG